MPEVIVIAHNIRSTYNVGAIFRTAEGLGVKHIILSGYTPYPKISNDNRLPHIAEKLHSQIHKTALGAEDMVSFSYQSSPDLATIKDQGYRLVALEQFAESISLANYHSPSKVALVLGEEVNGISADIVKECDDILEIPMFGQKESFNVSVAAAMALYQLLIVK